jgi:hypothetical protein
VPRGKQNSHLMRRVVTGRVLNDWIYEILRDREQYQLDIRISGIVLVDRAGDPAKSFFAIYVSVRGGNPKVIQGWLEWLTIRGFRRVRVGPDRARW